MKKYINLLFSALIITVILCQFTVSVSAKTTGTYSRSWKVQDKNYNVKTWGKPSYWVTINKVKKKKIRFQIGYIGMYATPLIKSNIITTRLKGKKAKFKWKDSWGSKGKGILILDKGYLKVKVTLTEIGEFANRSIDTNNQFWKLKKKNNSKKVEVYG